jgi:hypothetical protein
MLYIQQNKGKSTSERETVFKTRNRNDNFRQSGEEFQQEYQIKAVKKICRLK